MRFRYFMFGALAVVFLGILLAAGMLVVTNEVQARDQNVPCDYRQASEEAAEALHELAAIKELCGVITNPNDYVVCTHAQPPDAPSRTQTCHEVKAHAVAVSRWLKAFGSNVRKACAENTDCLPVMTQQAQSAD